jgi:hypothetical protein
MNTSSPEPTLAGVSIGARRYAAAAHLNLTLSVRSNACQDNLAGAFGPNRRMTAFRTELSQARLIGPIASRARIQGSTTTDSHYD